MADVLTRLLFGETKGERANRRRMKAANEAWRHYSGPMSRAEFMAKFLKEGAISRSKKAAVEEVNKITRQKLKAGKNITIDSIFKVLDRIDIRRTPIDETHFGITIEKFLPWGTYEHGEFMFAGTSHRPDFYINKDIVIEYKLVRSNTELHAALGQCLAYSYQYKYVILLLYDARQGYDAVDFSKKELQFLAERDIYVFRFPK